MSAQLSRDDWKGRVGDLSYRSRALIGGKFAKGLRAGSVWVKPCHGDDITTPFGGYKFTQLQTAWIQFG